MTKKTEAPTSNEIVKSPESDLAQMPDDLVQHAGHGSEGIKDRKQVRPARLRIAQSMSPQLKRSEPKYVKGLQEGNLFNDLTGEVYTVEPTDTLKIVVFSVLGVRAVEFWPRDSDQTGVKELDVKLTDPRCEWTQGEKGERVPPVATIFHDYLLWLPDKSEVVALSMKGGETKVAVTLNSLIKSPLKVGGNVLMAPPAWARTYLLGTVPTKNDKGTWSTLTLSVAGVTEADVRKGCAQLYEQFANVAVDVAPDESDAREARGPEEDVPF